MKKAFYILAPLLVALTLRLYPTLITGMPFSTDGWPLIRNTQLLMQNTPIPLNNKIFDNYNNYMPANSIFTAVLSEVTSITPISTMALGMPIVGTLAIPIFYVLANKITKKSKISLLASILLATAFPYAMFTSGVTKETFASPIYITLILLFLLKHNWKTTVVFSIVSIALTLSHQLTAFLTVAIISILTVGLFINNDRKERNINSNKSNILFIGILSAIIALYYGVYASRALTLAFTSSDLMTIGAYVIFVTAFVAYTVYKPIRPTPTVTFLKCAASFLVPAVILFLTTRVSLLPGAPTLPFHYFLYALPFLLAAPLIAYGLNDLHRNNHSLVTPVFWLTALLCLELCVVFSSVTGGEGIVYRLINFMLPPLSILTAIALYKAYNTKLNHVSAREMLKLATVGLTIIITATSTYTTYAAVSLQEPYLGYFWSYKPAEYAASNWLALNSKNQTITGDVKTQFLLNGYFKVSMSVLPGLDFLWGSGSEPSVLYVYNQMKTNGYVLYAGSPVGLPENWTNKLSDYDIVYSSTEVTVYTDPPQ